MRVISKEIVDYDALASEICNMAVLGNMECSLMLISAKADIERTYGGQCANYSVLVSSFEDGSDGYMIVPHDYKL